MATNKINKVLFLEDELALAEIVKENLESKGFEVMHARTLTQATQQYRQLHPDIIIADVMLPDGSGFDWIKVIRKEDTTTPVIFLTSRTQTDDVIQGFEMGGNDYLKKPFSIAELLVRMRSLLQRDRQVILQSAIEKSDWRIGDCHYLYPAGELTVANKMYQLTSREADLLQLLFLHRNQSVSRPEILQRLWGNTDYFSGRSLDVFVSKLRKYLSGDRSLKIINVRGIGYKLSSQ